MLYNAVEFDKLMRQSAPLGINISVIDDQLQNFPFDVEPRFSGLVLTMLKKWKSILTFELMSPFWFLEHGRVRLEDKHIIAAAAIRSSIAIKIMDDLEDIQLDFTHYPLLSGQCFSWWEECARHKLSGGDFFLVFENWRRFSRNSNRSRWNRETILSGKVPFYCFIAETYLAYHWDCITDYTHCAILLDDLMDVVEDYKLDLTNSIITPLINSGAIPCFPGSLNLLTDYLIRNKIVEKNLALLQSGLEELAGQSALFPFFRDHVKHVRSKIAAPDFRKYLYYKIFVCD